MSLEELINMMKGTLKGILDLLKKMLNCRINDINFEKDESYAVEVVEIVHLLNLTFEYNIFQLLLLEGQIFYVLLLSVIALSILLISSLIFLSTSFVFSFSLILIAVNNNCLFS